ncbi:unnamed protein product [Prorocentrum cordatum]|uniref:BTB domain-containing protein n=1 Tax=Prorocentrum cordatum TaxID=2364126 RepID=A0ABN9Y0Z5_9DINO|nr:unnamed protein product [Polarella glacialis]
MLPRSHAGVTVRDEPEVFLEMIKFVYLNTCHVDQSNVKALMHIADKYGVEDLVAHCLQWMHDHFTANLFYLFLTFKLSNERFAQKVRSSLLLALRSRRHFSLVTESAESQWDGLQVSFVEALLDNDELPVVSEAEVLNLLAKWASGALERQGVRGRSAGSLATGCSGTTGRPGSAADRLP